MKLKDIKALFTKGARFYHVSAWHVGYRRAVQVTTVHAGLDFAAQPDKPTSLFIYPTTKDTLTPVPGFPNAFILQPANFPVKAASLYVLVDGDLSPAQEQALQDAFVAYYKAQYELERAA